jgi:uncharacterized membrane protein YphA (DoxX/SURF4 family)
MKALLNNGYLILIARLVLGMLFIIASADKLADPSVFAGTIGNYRIMSTDLALVVATFLPWLELLCGLGILLGVRVHTNSAILAGLLVVFTISVIAALLRGLDISCGCFTQDPEAGKIGWLKVGENSLMLLAAIVLVFSTNAKFTVESYLRREH